ncbi:MAG: adenylate/guanylate cyclase domain-containing protein, partial [Verrucomicrobiota bacterium]
MTVSFSAARKAVQTLCQDLVNSGTDRVETDLRRFFAPVPPVLHIFRDWSETGILDDVDADRMNELFAPILESLPQIIGLSIGYSDGSGYMLSRGPDEYRDQIFRNQIVTPETAGKSSEWTTWETVDGPREFEVQEDEYDPRTRPWYKIVADDKDEDPADPKVHWTEPYPFFTTGAPGITASIRLEDKAGRTAVISLDLLLDDVSRLSETLHISPNGFMVVTTSDVRTIGLPRHPDLADPERRMAAFLKDPEELGIPLFADASNQFRKQFNLEVGEVLSLERGLSDENQPFHWSFERQGWWAYARPCVIEEGPQFWIAVAVPEDDFLGEIKAGRFYVLGLCGLALVVAGVTSVRLSRRYSSPIQALIRQADRLRTLNTEASDDQCTDIHEIAQLHDAQERMRLALDSFAKYVPSDVVRELLDKGQAAVIGGRHTSMSILFTDIEGFTSISEKMPPDQLTAHMANYFDAMIHIITEHNGTVDKLIG